MRCGVILLLGLAGGCSRPIQPELPTVQRYPELAGDAGFESVWTAAQTVLRRQRFQIDRLDQRAGLILTYPETSQHFFEFWRHDVDTAYDLLDASLRTVRRRAEVALRPVADAGWEMTVTVRKEYLSSPERQFNNSASVLRVFGAELPGVQGQERIRPEDEYWVDAGRDEAMETWLTDAITRAIERLQ